MKKIFVLVLLLITSNIYADFIPTQQCWAEDVATKGSFGGTCDGVYPSACGVAGDLLTCNDGNTESHTMDNVGYAGVKVTQFNSSVTNCFDISEVFVCFEWWTVAAAGPTDCDISIDNQGGTNFTAINTTCPVQGTSNPGMVCQNVTGVKNWTCSNFFGASGTRAQIKSETKRDAGAANKNVYWDILVYNITYKIMPTNLSIWDETDYITRYVNEQVKFFANYTNVTGGAISGAACAIKFNISGGWTSPASMSFNASSNLYEYSRTFDDQGTFNFNVSCSKTDYSPKETNSTFVITTAPTNLSIWDETDNVTKFPGGSVKFSANYTKFGQAVSDGSCNVSFNISGGWTPWTAMSFNSSSQLYEYSRTFDDSGTFDFNVSCARRGYQPQTANSTFIISYAIETNLSIWDETDNVTKYKYEQVKFYTNYTNATNPVVTANCSVSFNITGGWTTPVEMTYNSSSQLYEYNRSFSHAGTFNWNVTCSKYGYQSKTANSTFIIFTPAYVSTDNASYQACNIVYYKISVFDMNDNPVDSTLLINITNPSNTTTQLLTTETGNGGTGVYSGSYVVNSTAQVGSWWIRAIAVYVKGVKEFLVG